MLYRRKLLAILLNNLIISNKFVFKKNLLFSRVNLDKNNL
jgi:hypothetical protein